MLSYSPIPRYKSQWPYTQYIRWLFNSISSLLIRTHSQEGNGKEMWILQMAKKWVYMRSTGHYEITFFSFFGVYVSVILFWLCNSYLYIALDVILYGNKRSASHKGQRTGCGKMCCSAPQLTFAGETRGSKWKSGNNGGGPGNWE